MQRLSDLDLEYNRIIASKLVGRYITNSDIFPLINNLPEVFSTEIVGYSEQNRPIYSVRIGRGEIKIMIWSQMHGNESTCTKALFDVFNFFKLTSSSSILRQCSLLVIPILNPDGAEAYTRHNANDVDLNRDALQLTQKESRVLRQVFETYKPHYGFNMHDQRSLFNVGQSNQPATISFLSPAQDLELSVSPNRLQAMSVIHQMNVMLQQLIPGQVGRFDDAFNINCVGDYFQSKGVATILFEAGHFPEDYGREKTRKFIACSVLEALNVISSGKVSEKDLENYLQIPENNTLFFDIILQNVLLKSKTYEEITDLGITFKETLINNQISFLPQIKSMGDLAAYYGHKTINLHQKPIESSQEVLKLLGKDFLQYFHKYLLKLN